MGQTRRSMSTRARFAASSSFTQAPGVQQEQGDVANGQILVRLQLIQLSPQLLGIQIVLTRFSSLWCCIPITGFFSTALQ
jgi:hypothetical protein